jgi:hypothetical protein
MLRVVMGCSFTITDIERSVGPQDRRGFAVLVVDIVVDADIRREAD